MGVVVIEASAVRQDEIALHLVERKGPMGIELRELVLFLVLLETRGSKSARIFVRIFSAVIPCPPECGGGMSADELHGFYNRVHRLQILSRDPVFRFQSE